ncbi:MAG: sulfite exporter TauE/SafE family protein [Armatimonadetes bacterium]|nr:sulfite exporter TauE/SafE family protein [Armatimonadota bacterium]
MKLLTTVLPMTCVGVAAGTIAGLFGVGGGILMVPILVLLFGREQHMAQGTSLAVMLPLSIAGMARYAAKGNVEWMAAVPLAVGAVIGITFLGTPFAHALEGSMLRKLFGVLMMLTGLQMIGLFKLLGAWLGIGGPSS